jgi:hypothetical protein
MNALALARFTRQPLRQCARAARPRRLSAVEIPKQGDLGTVVELLVTKDRQHAPGSPPLAPRRGPSLLEPVVVEQTQGGRDRPLALGQMGDRVSGVAVAREMVKPRCAGLKACSRKIVLPSETCNIGHAIVVNGGGSGSTSGQPTVQPFGDPGSRPNVPALGDWLPAVLLVGQPAQPGK